MKEIKIIKNIPPRVKEIRLLKEEATSDLEARMVASKEEGPAAVFHRSPDEVYEASRETDFPETPEAAEAIAIEEISPAIKGEVNLTQPVQQSPPSQSSQPTLPAPEPSGMELFNAGEGLGDHAGYVNNAVSVNPSLEARPVGPSIHEQEPLPESQVQGLKEEIASLERNENSPNNTPASQAAKKFKYEWE